MSYFVEEIRYRIITEEYEQKLEDQEAEYSAKLKSLTKEMHSQMEEKDKQFNLQLQEIISKFSMNHQLFWHTISFRLDKSYQNESEMKQKMQDAEQRALIAEEQLKVGISQSFSTLHCLLIFDFV